VADVLRSDAADHYARFVGWWQPPEIAALTGEPPAEGALYGDALERSAALPIGERSALVDLVSYLPEDILTKVDRASMAVGLEVRAPLLDHRVVECGLGLPSTLRDGGRTRKPLLRRLLHRRVPPALVERPKMGFGVPLDDWFRGPLAERMSGCCAGDDLESLGIDPAPVRALWRDFQAGRSPRSDLLWQMFALVSWSRCARATALSPR